MEIVMECLIILYRTSKVNPLDYKGTPHIFMVSQFDASELRVAWLQ